MGVVGVDPRRRPELLGRGGPAAAAGEQEAEVVPDLRVARIETLRDLVLVDRLVVAAERSERHREVVPRRCDLGGEGDGRLEVPDRRLEVEPFGERLAGRRVGGGQAARRS